MQQHVFRELDARCRREEECEAIPRTQPFAVLQLERLNEQPTSFVKRLLLLRHLLFSHLFLWRGGLLLIDGVVASLPYGHSKACFDVSSLACDELRASAQQSRGR